MVRLTTFPLYSAVTGPNINDNISTSLSWHGTVQGLRNDPKLALPPGQNPSVKARVFVEEIARVSAEKVPENQLGFARFPMESSVIPESTAYPLLPLRIRTETSIG